MLEIYRKVLKHEKVLEIMRNYEVHKRLWCCIFTCFGCLDIIFKFMEKLREINRTFVSIVGVVVVVVMVMRWKWRLRWWWRRWLWLVVVDFVVVLVVVVFFVIYFPVVFWWLHACVILCCFVFGWTCCRFNSCFH